MAQPKTITVGELRDKLAEYDRDCELTFGGGNLSLYRVKNRLYNDAAKTKVLRVQLEFNELYEITLDPTAE